jgi:hypothetical protein
VSDLLRLLFNRQELPRIIEAYAEAVMPSLSDDDESPLPLPYSPPMQPVTNSRRRQPNASFTSLDPPEQQAFLPDDEEDKLHALNASTSAGKRSVAMHFQDSKWNKLIPPHKRSASVWSQIVRRRVSPGMARLTSPVGVLQRK